MLEATMIWWWWLSRHALRIQGNQPSQESGLISRSWMIQLISAFQATICGRFAPLATLEDEDAYISTRLHGHPLQQGSNWHSSWTSWQATPEELGYPRKSWVTPEILDLCDQRRDLKKKREASQKDPKTIGRLKERSGQRWRWQKRLGYRVNARKWKNASERITVRKHTS